MSKELFLAVKEGDKAKVELALAKSDCDVNFRGHSDITPIRVAAMRDRYEIAQLLLARKDIKVDSTDSDTPLVAACLAPSLRMVKLLLPHSNLFHEDSRQEIPYQIIKRSFQYAKTEQERNSYKEIFELVRDATYLAAAKRGFVVGVTTMLNEEKANKNAVDHLGRSALMLATMVGATSVVDELIKARVNIDYVNPETGLSALTSTAILGATTYDTKTKTRLLTEREIAQTEIAVKLIRAGANPNQMLTRPKKIAYVMELLEEIASDLGKAKYFEKIFQALIATNKLDLTVPYPLVRQWMEDGEIRSEFMGNQNILYLLKKIEPKPGKLHALLEPVYTQQIANTAPVVEPERPLHARDAQRFVHLAQFVQTESDARTVVQSMARSTGRTMEQTVSALGFAPETPHYLHNPMPTTSRMGTLPPPIAPQAPVQQQRSATTAQLPPPLVSSQRAHYAPAPAQPTPSAPPRTIRPAAAQLPPPIAPTYQPAANVGPTGMPSMREATNSNNMHFQRPTTGAIPIQYTQGFQGQTFQNVSPSRN